MKYSWEFGGHHKTFNRVNSYENPQYHVIVLILFFEYFCTDIFYLLSASKCNKNNTHIWKTYFFYVGKRNCDTEK